MFRVLIDRAGVRAQHVRGGIGTRREGLPTVSPIACRSLAVAGDSDHTTDPTFFPLRAYVFGFGIGFGLRIRRAFLDYAKFVCGERGAPSPVAHTNLYEELLLR